MSEPSERNVPGRVAAYEAAITVAVEKAATDSRWYRSFKTSDVAERVGRDVSERTVRRALKDAAEYGWVSKDREGAKKWKPGLRADEFAPESD